MIFFRLFNTAFVLASAYVKSNVTHHDDNEIRTDLPNSNPI
jgi:hypothetical protein